MCVQRRPLPTPAAPPHARMHVCRGGVRRAAPSVSPHALAAPTARAPRRAAGNQIGDEGAKELAAALKTNTTLTHLGLGSACSGAPSPPPRHRRTRARTFAGGGVRRAAPSVSPHARAAPTARAPRRAADNYDIKDKAALAAIESILDANKARPPASVRRAFASGRDPTPRSAALLGASALHAPSPRECLYPPSACHAPRP